MTGLSKTIPFEPIAPTIEGDITVQNLRHELQENMIRCRQLTRSLVEPVDYATCCRQAHPDFSPIGWHLGHIAFTESLWLLEHFGGQAPRFPRYKRLFAADGLPKSERVNLPTMTELWEYLDTVRNDVFVYLEQAPLAEQKRIWRFLLQHESQHCETIAILLELLHNPATPVSTLPQPTTDDLSTTEMVCIPAGEFTYGSMAIAALDNERPQQRLYLDTYWIDRYPVTCHQYRQFIAAGGYTQQEWWSPAGWEWLQSTKITQPLYWRNHPDWNDHPVCGVSWYEAEAYAHFVGKRLPTEFEWEKAASWNPLTNTQQLFPWGETAPDETVCNHSHLIGQTTPVNHYPAGVSPAGCYDLLGNVWEWTMSWFDGYEGFEPFPYRGYSQAYFDGQHRVLRGGSWATRSWAMRGSFHNWYYPHVREILAGFRCASDRQPGSTT